MIIKLLILELVAPFFSNCAAPQVISFFKTYDFFVDIRLSNMRIETELLPGILFLKN